MTKPACGPALAASFLRSRAGGWKPPAGAAEALSRFRRGMHPLVVSDMRMPDGDGLAVMREVRPIAPQTAVILLTAFGTVADAVSAMQDGACDYLMKPVAFEHLAAAARGCWSGRAEGEGRGRRRQSGN